MKTVQVILLSLISLVLAIGQVSVSHAAALAQDLFEFEWVQGAGGSGVDEGISIATDNAGNVIVVGDFFNEITIGNTTLTSLGSSDIFVAKYDPNGNFLWAFQIGGVSSDNVAGVAVNATDWIFIAGNFRNTVDFGDPAFGEGTLTSFGGPDIFIAQYYPNGDLFEVEQAGGTDYDYAKAITVTAVSAKPLVTGTFQTGQNGFNIGLGVYTSQGEHSAFVYRAFSGFNGWTAVIRGDRWEEGSAIAVDASNNVYVTGYFHNEIATTFNSGSGDGSPISLQSKGLDDSYVAKWNFSGELQWVEQITGSPSEYGVGIAADDFGNAIVTGKFNGTAIFGSDTLITDGDPHMFIAKYSGNGNFLWAQEGPEIFDGVAVDQNNDIVVTGNFAGSFQFGDIDLYSPGTQDNLFVAIYDGSGNPVWATQAGGPTQYNYINSNGIAIDGNNNILLTGSYNGNGYFGEMTLPSIGTNDDVFIAKMTLTEPQLAVSPLAIDFDTTRMNTWASRSVTITNIGGMDLIISDFSIYGDDWEQFGEQTWVLPYTLGFNQSRTLTVNFHPDDVGIFNATLHIYANVGDQQVSLTGRGGLPEISVTPDSVDFGVVSLEESGTEQLTISNTGPVDLHVTSIAISGVDAVNFSVETIPLPLTLSTDASQILNVSFAPDTVGGFSAYLDIESDDENVSIPLTAEGSGPILFVDPTLLEFGDILVGDSSDAMTITIRNIGSLPLEVSGIASSDSAIFSVSLAEDGGLRIDGLPRSVDISFTLNPGDSQNVIVTFTPNTAVEYDESLSISTNAGTGSVNLRGTGVAPELSVSSIFNFGNQLIGGNYSRNISVRNIGGYELNITSIVFGEADTAYFSVDTSVIKFFPSKFTVAPYGSHYVPVTFAPEDTISYNASVSIESDGGNATVQLQGTGIAFSVSPLSLNYGEVPFLTDSSTLTTTITNSLFDTLEIFDIISSDTAIFLVSLDGKNLIAGETQDVLVTFAPLAETQYNEQLSISTNYGDEVVNLTGTGIPVPVISVTPSSIGFGEVAESNSVKDSVIVTNTGTGTLHVGSITTSGDEAAYFSATPTSLSVASGDTQFVEVTFTPVGDIQSYSATLNFSSDGGGATVSLSGSLAPPPLPELSVSPASLNFGGVMVEDSLDRTITVRNTGDADLVVSSIVSSDEALFSSITTIPFTLAPNASQQVTVTFLPDTLGEYSGTISISSNGGSVDVSLLGSGVGLSVLSSSIDFGEVFVDTTTTDTIIIVNTSSSESLMVDSLRISNGDSSNFMIDSTLVFPFTLAPGDSQEVIVTFAPDTLIEYNEVMSIYSDAGDASVDLRGLGVGLFVSTFSVDFGEVVIGETATEQVTVTNTGTADLNVSSIAITGVDSVNFSVDTTPFTLAPGDSLLLEVSFTPDTVGVFSASLDIDSDGGSASVALAGNGVEPQTGNLVLWNTLGSDAELKNSLVGPSFTPLQPLTYSPAGKDNGVLSDNDDPVLSISNSVLNAEEGTISLWVKLVSVPSTYPNATEHLFLSTPEMSLRFLSNDGNAHSGWFAMAGGSRLYSINSFGTTSTSILGANDEEILLTIRWNSHGVPGHGAEKVVFFRNDVRIGTHWETGAAWPTEFSGDLILNQARYNPTYASGTVDLDLIYDDIKIYDVSLTDQDVIDLYTESEEIPVFSVTPLSIDFGDVSVGETATEQVTVTNGGGASLEVTAITSTLEILTISETSFTVAPGDTHEITLTLTPSIPGEISGMLTITSNDPDSPTEIAITGNAQEEELVGDFDGDGQVALGDFSLFVTTYGSAEGDDNFDPLYDLDGNGQIGLGDFSIFVQDYGKRIGSAKMVPVIAEENGPASLSMDMVDQSGEGSGDVHLKVWLDGVKELRGYSFKVRYDADRFDLKAATRIGERLSGDGNGLWPLLVVSRTAGEVIIADVVREDEGMEGDDVLVELRFLSKGYAEDFEFTVPEGVFLDVEGGMYALGSAEATALPEKFALLQNFPNPFNPVTTIAYDLPQASEVTLTLYTVTGQKVKVLVDGHQEAGHHTIRFDGSGFANGVYLYRLEAGSFVETRRMVLIR